jgi:diguanylate cyclase (GGDEF)-like protein
MANGKKDFTILITDDEKMNVDVLGGILSPSYNLLISRNGTRAIELAKNHKPDLILLDVLMPDMTGFEVIVELKNCKDTINIPVIFITGLTSSEDEEKGFVLGAVDYITKPFKKAIVKARVNTHIRIVDQMRMIESIGLIDPLTKVSNRRGFENRLDMEWNRSIREQTPICLLMMDIDKFKNFNDTYGHQHGDFALSTFASIATKSLLRSIDFIARWGGEEFVILLPSTDIDGAVEVAERVRSSIEEAVITTENGVVTPMTVSIGINSLVPNKDDGVDEFIKVADQALYKAKETGRNRYVVAKRGEA